MDFFVIGGRSYFSELTFYTQACVDQRWQPPSFDHLLGQIVATPETRITPQCLADAMLHSCKNPGRARFGRGKRRGMPGRRGRVQEAHLMRDLA